VRRDPSAVRVGRLPGSAASAVQRHDDHTARRRTKRPAIRGAPAANRGAWRGPARIAWVTAFLTARPRSGSPRVSLMTGWDTQNAIVRLLAVLVSLSCALAGCGRGTAGPASLAKLLPEEVGGAELHREAFTGKVWLKRGRSNFSRRRSGPTSRNSWNAFAIPFRSLCRLGSLARRCARGGRLPGKGRIPWARYGPRKG